jgi:hypothetical protein
MRLIGNGLPDLSYSMHCGVMAGADFDWASHREGSNQKHGLKR